jgi:hypothetical protein
MHVTTFQHGLHSRGPGFSTLADRRRPFPAFRQTPENIDGYRWQPGALRAADCTETTSGTAASFNPNNVTIQGAADPGKLPALAAMLVATQRGPDGTL